MPKLGKRFKPQSAEKNPPPDPQKLLTAKAFFCQKISRQNGDQNLQQIGKHISGKSRKKQIKRRRHLVFGRQVIAIDPAQEGNGRMTGKKSAALFQDFVLRNKKIQIVMNGDLRLLSFDGIKKSRRTQKKKDAAHAKHIRNPAPTCLFLPHHRSPCFRFNSTKRTFVVK